jgi:uncharacterized protein YjbI with pentapeptide repeats
MSRIEAPEIVRIIDRGGNILYQCEAASLKEALRHAVAAGVVIRNVDLSYADLSFAELDDGIFCNVSFKGANLTGANLSEACIQGCDFTQARLVAACFPYTRISTSHFKFTDFAVTDFTCAELQGCDFSGPSVFNIDFTHVDMMENACLYDDQHKEYMHLSIQLLRFAAGNERYIVSKNYMHVNGCIKRTENTFIGYVHRELCIRKAA